MNFKLSNKKAIFILVLMLVILGGGSVISSKWQTNIFKSLDKRVMNATVAPESFYFDNADSSLQQNSSNINELAQNEVPQSPAEPVPAGIQNPDGAVARTNLTISEIQERLDDIAEQVDILAEEVNQTLALNNNNQEDNNIQEDDNNNNNSNDQHNSLASIINGGGTNTSVNYCDKLSQVSALRDKVIFNEIAWMGTKTSSNDEWVELKNISVNPIDLTGWQILDKEKQIKIAFGTEIIPANGFILLERTDDTSVPGITADLIYVGILKTMKMKNCIFSDRDAGLKMKL